MEEKKVTEMFLNKKQTKLLSKIGNADYATTAEIYIHQDKQTLIDAINKI